ncbi:hypothetical protein F5883DRAFT_591015 [Diaporthe sp. PMI_573]|nr:hypothetical protein F5883DRAFT_591015 [Diaporthaceae sp. PMI_573]
MGSQEHLPAAVFAPSPPLTTSPGTSDCDAEGSKPSGRRRKPQAPEGEPSPSSSFTSADPPVTRPCSDLDTAFELVRAAWQGNLPDDLPCPEWHVLTISPAQFLDLCERLEKEGLLKYFEDLRYDYNPDRSELVLRLMETALHACMTERIRDAIKSQLQKLPPQPDGAQSDSAQSDTDAPLSDYDPDALLSRLASKINTYGHMKIRLQAETGPARRSPDGQLCYDIS